MIRTGEEVVVTTPLSRAATLFRRRHAEPDTPVPSTWPTMRDMPKVPESTKSSLAYKLHARARERWPQLADANVTHRAGFAYVNGVLADGQQLRLCRLRYGGSASRWGFSIYRASHDDYQPSMLPDGLTAGSPEDALDTACGLYLGDPIAWVTPPKN